MDDRKKNVSFTQGENALLIEAKLLALSMKTFEESVVRSKKDDLDEATEAHLRDILSASICRLGKLIVPNIQTKIDEIIYSEEKKMIVLNALHGADMIDEKGNFYELKVSSCKKTKNYKCNFNWPIPAGKDAETRRKKLLDSVVEKTGGNSLSNVIKCVKKKEKETEGAKVETSAASEKLDFEAGGGFKAICKSASTQVTIEEHFFTGVFVYHYFRRMPNFPQSANYNFGCERCKKCESYHRLNKLKEYDDYLILNLFLFFKEKKEIYWDPQEEKDLVDKWLPWDRVFAPVASQCK